MNPSQFGRNLLSLCSASVLAVGCAAESNGAARFSVRSTWPPPAVWSGIRPRGRRAHASKKHEPLIYVASGPEVWIFNERQNAYPIGGISDGVTGAYGLYVDARKTLYVANDGNNTITAYPAGSLTPSATYSEDLSRPLYPIVDRDGNLFVSNADNGTVVEYRPGSVNAYRVLQTGGTEADGLDFDERGNLYVAYRHAGGAGIEKFAPGSKRGRSLGIALDQPQGLIVTERARILVVETGDTNRIDEFLPEGKRPELEVSVPGTPVELAITQGENELFVSALGGAVYVTPFPLRNPNLVQEVDGGYGTQGLALSNGQHF